MPLRLRTPRARAHNPDRANKRIAPEPGAPRLDSAANAMPAQLRRAPLISNCQAAGNSDKSARASTPTVHALARNLDRARSPGHRIARLCQILQQGIGVARDLIGPQ